MIAISEYGIEKEKTRTKRLTKNIEENRGIAYGKEFETENEFQEFLEEWLKGRTLYRYGYRGETAETREWDKKEEANVIDATTEPPAHDGAGDVGIHHDFLNLSWSHILVSPLIIECKLADSFRHAGEQSIRYKMNSSQKYQEVGGFKGLNTAVATPQSLSTGEIADRHGVDDPYPINFEAKRIFWKMGIGVLQSANPGELVISFGESDVVVIK